MSEKTPDRFVIEDSQLRAISSIEAIAGLMCEIKDMQNLLQVSTINAIGYSLRKSADELQKAFYDIWDYAREEKKDGNTPQPNGEDRNFFRESILENVIQSPDTKNFRIVKVDDEGNIIMPKGCKISQQDGD